MIKLKDLILENGQSVITAEALKNYWNFVLNALKGAMKESDHFYRQYKNDIDLIAGALVKKYGPHQGGKIYRGIILADNEIINGKVQHAPELTFVSFSEDKNIAIAFGDIENPMSDFVIHLYPNKKGYLITAEFRPEQLLFHHSWIHSTGMKPMIHQYFGDHAKYVELQKEVMIKPRPYYRVEPVEPGASGGLEVGME